MTEPIRIPQVIGMLAAGGVENVVFNYYKNIDRQKIQFDFIVHENSPVKMPQEILDLGARVYYIPSYKNLVSYIKSLYNLFKKNGYSIVHVHMNTMSVFSLFSAWLAGIKIRVCHNHSTANKKEGIKALMKYILRPFNRLFATHYFACGEYAAEWMYGKRNVEKANVTVLNNAIDLVRFSPNPVLRKLVRENFGIEDKLVIGHMGRFAQAKNHTFLLDIFSAVHKKKPNSVLLLAGEGELEPSIRRKVAELGLNDSIIFYGITGYAATFYQALDVFVLPSLFEGFPVVGLEVQAVGIPVVASDNVTSKLKIADVEFMSLSESPEKWADCILMKKELSENNAQLLRNAGYDIKLEAKKLESFYLSVLK